MNAHPQVGSFFLLNGLVNCRNSKRAPTGQNSKTRLISYYPCQPMMERGTGARDYLRLTALTPRWRNSTRHCTTGLSSRTT